MQELSEHGWMALWSMRDIPIGFTRRYDLDSDDEHDYLPSEFPVHEGDAEGESGSSVERGAGSSPENPIDLTGEDRQVVWEPCLG
jgi:hypothetical protein